MRIFVVYDDESELQDAIHMQDVLARMSSTLSAATVDRDGGVTINHTATLHSRILVQAVNWRNLFDQVTRRMLKV